MNERAVAGAGLATPGEGRSAVQGVAELLDGPRGRTPRMRPALKGRQKAAIIVRLLLADGAQLPLSSLPEHLQAALTEQMGSMRLVDRETMRAVVAEFQDELESVGLSFPGGIDGAISMLDGHISTTAASRLRRLASASGKADPWERVAGHDGERLLPVLQEESAEVGAVMLSKLSVDRAAALLEKLPGERARRLTQAMSRTARVDPETVRRIGLALAAQLESLPPRAFETGPVERVGAILNSAPATTRDSVLEGLRESDPDFAEQVRRAIFTFAHIPGRVPPRAVPLVLRAVAQDRLLAALVAAGAAGGAEAASAEFLLANISQRMADALREGMAEAGPVDPRAGEEAMAAVIAAIRELEGEGTLTLLPPDAGAPVDAPPAAVA